jgi:hypothetical protein
MRGPSTTAPFHTFIGHYGEWPTAFWEKTG